MRRTWTGLLVLGIALVVLGGCAYDEHLKPSKIDHEYVLPPRDDSRFSSFPQFPDKTLNNWQKKSTPDDMSTPPGFQRSPRMGAGGLGATGF